MVQNQTVSRQIGHDGTVLGDSNVSLQQNTTGREDTILELECPRKFDAINYVGRQHPTKFVPRALQTVSGTTGDDTAVTLNGDIVPIAGEEKVSEQPHPVAVAYNTTTGTQYDIVDVDYSTNTVTLGTDPASGDSVKIWYVITEGELKYQGMDVFENPSDSVHTFGVPVHLFADLNQNHKENRPHLSGGMSWNENERLLVQFESPRQIVWQDADYPEGEFVSSFQQTVNVE